MSINWNQSVWDRISEEGAKVILIAAIMFEDQHRQRVSVPNPRPYLPETTSKEGEYPRLRTGAGRGALMHQPTTVADVVKTGWVRVGLREGDHHLLILEISKKFNRLGLAKTLEDMTPQLRAVIGNRTVEFG